MKTRFRLPLMVLGLSLPLPVAAQQVQDFSLPTAPTPSASPRAQGPVDTESGALPVRPRVIATGTPTPAPSATPSPAPVVTATNAPRPSATATRQSSQGPAFSPPSRPGPVSPSPTPVERQPVVPQEFPVASDNSDAGPAVVPTPQATPVISAQPAVPASVEDGGFDWKLPAALLAGLALAVFGFVFWRRRTTDKAPPEIERPVVAAPTPAPPAAASAPLPAGEVLTIRCEAEKLTRSAMFATLKYRLILVNRTDNALNDVAIGIDLVSAHAKAPMEEQVATPATTLETRHNLQRIAPRQNVTVEGQVQLPLAGAQVIFQGRHPLLVPLMRVRVDGAGDGALVKTFVVGQGVPDGGRVQPFRLDEGPRSYAPIAHRELA